MGRGTKKSWKDLTGRQRVAVVVLGVAQTSLMVAGFRDLVRRPADQVDGPKLAWGLAMLVSWVGPAAYFVKGRKRPTQR